MTTTIIATCTQCGTVNSVPSGAMLATVDTECLDSRMAGSVCWICCGCLDIATEPVAWQPFVTLLTAGVPLVVDDPWDDELDDCSGWSTPGSVSLIAALSPHPEHPVGGPAFTPDNELDMHELLAGEKWFLELVAAGAQARPQP